MKERLIQMTRNRPAKILWWFVLTIAMAGFTAMAYILFIELDSRLYERGTESYWDTYNAHGHMAEMAQATLPVWADQEWEAPINPATPGFEEAQETPALPYELYYIDEYGTRQQDIYASAYSGEKKLVARTYIMIYPGQKGYATLGRAYFKDDEIVAVYDINGLNTITWDPDTNKIEIHPEAAVTAFQEGDVSVWVQQENITGEPVREFTMAQQTENEPTAQPNINEDTKLGAFDQYVDEQELAGTLLGGTWSQKTMQRELVLYNLLHAVYGKAFVIQLVCVLVGVFALVMIGLGAGWKENANRPQLCWYDKIPMEVQLILFGILTFLGFFIVSEWNGVLLWSWNVEGVQWLLPSINTYAKLIFAMISMIVGTFLIWELAAWAIFFSFVRWAKQGNLFGSFWLVRLLKATCSAVPLIWQCTLLMAVAGVIQFYLTIYSSWDGPVFALLFGGFVWLVMYICIAHAALSLQDLRRQVKAFLAGDYEAKPKFSSEYPVMREISEDICRVGDGMNAAVEQRLKSERMKTELITNVSHDLKTPLTSIINYTDLLQHEELPPQAAEYAEIIARQGERLHKLTVDLVEASKAASGVMSCTKVPTDVKELCEQAMGEYTERLTAVGLIPVLNLPEEDLVAQLDGRLTWRILDNLLSNACKYAQPGTRVYLVVEQQEGKVSLTLKNISRDPLNVPAEELMERFVRGDSARSSEGSGLGLSIARSLAELQGGTFQLYVNGDLFQAQATFPLGEAQ